MSYQSGGRSGGTGFTVGVEGTRESLRVLTRAGANLHGLDTGDVYMANSMLRRSAKVLAEQVARTTVVPLLMAGPAPQSRAMAATVRARSDRMPFISIGAVNPKLSGWRRSAQSRRYRGSLAWGIEKGPGNRPPNRYGTLSRSARGHVIGPNMAIIEARTVGPYKEIVRRALESAGVTSWQGRAA